MVTCSPGVVELGLEFDYSARRLACRWPPPRHAPTPPPAGLCLPASQPNATPAGLLGATAQVTVLCTSALSSASSWALRHGTWTPHVCNVLMYSCSLHHWFTVHAEPARLMLDIFRAKPTMTMSFGYLELRFSNTRCMHVSVLTAKTRFFFLKKKKRTNVG